jgi:hypothetical protein
MNDTSPTSQGGTMTAAENAIAPLKITASQHAELMQMRQTTAGPKADGYLAVQLVGFAGWNPQQTATFLGISQPDVLAWCRAWQNGGTNALRTLDAPARDLANPGG